MEKQLHLTSEGDMRISGYVALFTVLLFAVCSLTLVAPAQEYRGSLNGTVTDPTGALIPGAKVAIKNNATGVTTTVGSSAQGDYTAVALDPGIYTVTVTATGFKTLVRQNVEVRTGEKLGLDLAMEVGAVAQQVTVTTESPLLTTDTGSGGTVLNSDLVGDLPLLGSNVFSLINTTSGNSHVAAFPDHLSERPFDNGGMDGYSMNGGPAGGNNNSYLIDGAPNNNNEGLGFVPPPDAVSQVNVMTNAYDSEFGKTGGAITSVALKTGTNSYHGVAYWNVRNNHLNANLWQNHGRPSQVTQWSEPGFQFGGPVRVPGYDGRDKTFFSVSYEHFFDTVPSSVTRTYASPSQLAGNFCSGAPGNEGIGTVIYDPTTNPRTPIGGGSGVGNIDNCPGGQTGSIIPANRIDPVMKAILANVPTANVSVGGVLCTNPRASGCLNNFTSSNAHGDHYHAITVRIDHKLTENNKIFASYEDGNRLEYIANPGATGTANAGLFPLSNTWRINHGATANLTSILSPTLTSTAKVNWLRHDGLGRSAASGSTPSSLGLSSALQGLFGANNFPGVGFNTNITVAAPPAGSNISYTGFSQGGQNTTSLNDNWTAQETLNKVYGAHSIKFGGLVTITTQNNKVASLVPTINFSDVFTRASVGSASSTTGDAIATALLGYPTSISYTSPFRASYETRYFGLFAQDDWRISKKLTVNLGLRWDAQSAPHERYNRAVVNFNPSIISVGAQPNTAPGATNGLGGTYLGGVVYASPDARSPFGNAFQNWGPRFGFAYQISNKLVFRGGWGRFYDYAGAYTALSALQSAESTGFASTSTINATPDSFQTPTLCSATAGCVVPPGNLAAGLSAGGYSSIFPSGLVPISGSSLGARTGGGTTISFIDPNFKPAYVNQFNAGFEYKLPGETVFHIEYNGSRSHNVPLTNLANGALSKNINSVTSSQFLSLNTALTGKLPNPFFSGATPLYPGTSFIAPQLSLQQLLSPFPQYQSVTESSISVGRLWYNSLQARIDKRMSHGLTFMANFTWSKNLGQTTLLNPNFDSTSGAVREPVNIDQPFLLNLVMTYRIPVFNNLQNHFARAALGGWTLAGTGQFQSGSLISSPGIGTGFGPAAGALSANVKWTGVDPTKSIPGVWTGQTTNRWFNNCVLNATGTAISNTTGASACPASTPLADAPWQLQSNQFFLNNIPPYFEHNRTRRPPVASLALFKSFAITERVKFEIRADAYNLTNTPWFGFGDNSAGVNTSSPTTSSFGSVILNQGNDPRTIQLTGRFSF